MTGPSPGQIDVAIQALHDDAQKWRAAAGELEIAALVAGEMDFQAFHFSYIGDKVGVTDGAVNFRNVAQALTMAANSYQEEDRNAVHRLKNIW